MNTITILRSFGPRLAKLWREDGTIEGYDRAKHFSVDSRPVNNLVELSEILADLEHDSQKCVVRGEFAPGADRGKTTRDLENFTEVPRPWLCVDVDSHDTEDPHWLEHPELAIGEFIAQHLPPEFHSAGCHWQLSNSAGAPGNPTTLKAHLWLWLDEPRTGPELERWARALRLPIDVTVFRTVQVHYTSAPVINEGTTCPVIRRHGLLPGGPASIDMLSIPEIPRPAGGGRSGMSDPREKKGIVGAFCRAYPPARAVLELLPHVFEFEGDSDTRLTWLRGGGAQGGAVITDDEQHVYNSHSTDPFEGKACNSWDLCRVHLFGDLDDKIDPDAVEWAGPTILPSHKEMVKLAMTLEDVEVEREQERAERAEQREQQKEAERVVRLSHLDTLRAGVQGCRDVESLKTYVRDVLVPDDQVDDTDRNGALTVAVQAQFALLDSPQRRDDVRKMLRPPRQSGAAGGPGWLEDWVYVTATDKFLCLSTKTEVTVRAFDVINSERMPLSQDGIRREKASEWAVHVWGVQTVDNTLYAPGREDTFEALGLRWGNLYSDATVPEALPFEDSVAVRMIEDHLRRMFPDDRERSLLLSWMGYNTRSPGRKVRWAPYIYGPQGNGKTFIAVLLQLAMGDAHVKILAGSTLLSAFNGWATGAAVTAIEEVYQSGHLFETEEKLKAVVSNDYIDVHRKGRDPYTTLNTTNYLLLSNHGDALPIGEGDRRYFFLRTAIDADQAKALSDEGYFDTLFDTVRASPGQIRGWLESLGVHPDFDPQGRARVTGARQDVIEMSRTVDEEMILDACRGRRAVAVNYLYQLFRAARIDPPRTRQVSAMLAKIGFEYLGRVQVNGERTRVYGKRGAQKPTDQELRDLAAFKPVDEFPSDE